MLLIVFLTCFGIVNSLEQEDWSWSAGRQLKQTDNSVDSAVQHLSEFIQFETVSDAEKDLHVGDKEVFLQAISYLETTYPLVWTNLKIQKVSDLSLLIEWPGSNNTLLPMLYVAHYDVVPVENTEAWTYPPFSGEIADGYVWGRGTLDMKGVVIGVFEALTELLMQEFDPQRTIYFGLGHDEEVGGGLGAKIMAKILQEKGVHLELIIDEGSFNIVDNLGPVNGPISAVGIAEKGYVTFQLDIQSSGGGHSSAPPIDGSSVASIISRVISRLDANPSPISIKPPVQEMLMAIAPNAPTELQPLMSMANNQSVQDVIGPLLAQDRIFSALIRNTAAVTIISAGVAENVLPKTGKILINYRTLPGDGTKIAMENIQTIIGEDADSITVTMLESDIFSISPNTSSPWFGPHWDIMKQAINEVIDNNTLVAPTLILPQTDSRYYRDMSKYGVYRYFPINFYTGQDDIGRIHGDNERILIDDVCTMVQFYMKTMQLYDHM